MKTLYVDYRGGFAPGLPPAEFLAARKHGRRIVLLRRETYQWVSD